MFSETRLRYSAESMGHPVKSPFVSIKLDDKVQSFVEKAHAKKIKQPHPVKGRAMRWSLCKASSNKISDYWYSCGMNDEISASCKNVSSATLKSRP
jgi:hypothetical protein